MTDPARAHLPAAPDDADPFGGPPCPPLTAPNPGEGEIVRDLPVVNRRGLHARASAKFVATVERFDAEVSVTRCGETVGGLSIMGLLTLGAAPGCSVRVSARGRQAAEVMAALEALLADRFGEGE